MDFGKKTGRKEPFGKLRRKWEDTFKMDLRETGREDMEWFYLAQDKVQWRVTKSQVP